MQVYHPYDEKEHDRLAQLCQVQIFFALLSSLSLKYAKFEDTKTLDVLLSIVMYIPIALSVYLETPLAEYLNAKVCRKLLAKVCWVSKGKEAPAYANHLLESSNVAHLDFANFDPGCASASTDADEHTVQEDELAQILDDTVAQGGGVGVQMPRNAPLAISSVTLIDAEGEQGSNDEVEAADEVAVRRDASTCDSSSVQVYPIAIQ